LANPVGETHVEESCDDERRTTERETRRRLDQGRTS
jgi:hypothetical protein